MKSLHKMLIHVINTLELCDHKNDRQQCYNLITELIKQLHEYDNCIEEGDCVASVPEHFLLHSISTALQSGKLQKMFNQEKNTKQTTTTVSLTQTHQHQQQFIQKHAIFYR